MIKLFEKYNFVLYLFLGVAVAITQHVDWDALKIMLPTLIGISLLGLLNLLYNALITATTWSLGEKGYGVYRENGTWHVKKEGFSAGGRSLVELAENIEEREFRDLVIEEYKRDHDMI